MQMKLSCCKISRNKQLELIKLFIAQTTARTASDLVGVNRRTGILFFNKLRQIIATNLFEIEEGYFQEKLKLMRVILVAQKKVSEAGVLLGKCLYSAFSRGAAKFIPR